MNQHGGLVGGPGQGISVPRGQRHHNQANLHGQGAIAVHNNAQNVNQLSNQMNHGGPSSSQAISSGSVGGGNPGGGGGGSHQNHRNHHQIIHGQHVQGGHGNVSQQAQMNLGQQPGTVVSNAGGQGVPQHGGPQPNFIQNNPWGTMNAPIAGNHNAYGIQTSNPYAGGHPGSQAGHLLHPGSGPGTPATFIQGPGQPGGVGANQPHQTLRLDAAAIQSINVSTTISSHYKYTCIKGCVNVCLRLLGHYSANQSPLSPRSIQLLDIALFIFIVMNKP